MAIIGMAWYIYFYHKSGIKGFVIVSLLASIILIQGFKAFPYTPLAPRQVLAGTTGEKNTSLSLFICNVLQSNKEYARVLNRISEASPDIVITTESNATWQQHLSVLEDNYTHNVFVPQENTYGMHLYSRLPLRNTAVRYLLEPKIPSIKAEVQLRSGKWVHLFVVHPRPPFPSEDEDSKERDAEILMVAREARELDGGVIVAGDFNDVAWSRTTKLFQEVSGFLDPRRGRGFYNTFHANYPVFRWPLDHIFHSPHFRLISLERLDKVGSDHFPMFVALNFEPEKKAEQPKVKPDGDTEKKANETIEKGKQDAADKDDK